MQEFDACCRQIVFQKLFHSPLVCLFKYGVIVWQLSSLTAANKYQVSQRSKESPCNRFAVSRNPFKLYTKINGRNWIVWFSPVIQFMQFKNMQNPGMVLKNLNSDLLFMPGCALLYWFACYIYYSICTEWNCIINMNVHNHQ